MKNNKVGTLVKIKYYLSFSLLLLFYIVRLGVRRLPKSKISTLLEKSISKATSSLNTGEAGSISRISLIELAIRNMQAKKTRTTITVGGMAIGIGAIVFLVSIGYGLQALVISRVARLEEIKQTDVAPQTGGKVRINDKVLADFKGIPNVTMVLPIISVVGEVNYQNSVTDMAVYGVTADYLNQSAIKPTRGRIFENNSISIAASPEVSGAATGGEVNYSIKPGSWVKVRESPSASSKLLGYTKGIDVMRGIEVTGSKYISNSGITMDSWIESSFLLWQKTGCDPATEGDCENGGYKVMRDADNYQLQKEGYTSEIDIEIISSGDIGLAGSDVLGTSTSLMPSVTIASESAVAQTENIKTVDISGTASKNAILNMAALKVLGINENEAVGKTFSVTYVVTGNLLDDPGTKVQSVPVSYTITAVIPDNTSPLFYVPFTDIRSLGITNYSQVKIVADSQNNLSKIRNQIEAMGFVTQSVADTVSQINSLFSTLRTILALLGMVALAVAALGMFNTLTVSLLERTREVGLMKAMGMKSSEVQELFLTESMIMGILGGVLGIILGFLAGKLLGFLLSIFSVFRGVGYIDVSSIPIQFVIIVLLLGLIVGLTTGIYPARRAKNIPALNALRYE